MSRFITETDPEPGRAVSTERTADSQDRTVECWCRSLARTDGAQAAVVERLEWLLADGTIDGLHVETWPAVVPADRSWALGEHERRVHDRLEAFERWADRMGAELAGAFGERRAACETPLDRTVEAVRVLPVVALAEYRGDELVALSPAVEDGETRRVEDHLRALGKGREHGPGLRVAGD